MKKILVVDDNQQNLYFLKVLLSANGFDVEMASNGEEALSLARQSPPYMIVSDILMPVMDGYALCKVWREDVMLKNIPFIFYSATYTEQKDQDFALKLGADRFIIKPVEPDTF
ncbi:MAG TPA: response regulator, partial [Chitinispirillaceae bacterium]|nr:response regulator [Chitinispirillaceae bacterium]